jgi:hypothetical protein
MVAGRSASCFWKSCVTEQDRRDGRYGFDSDEGVVLESDGELHDHEEVDDRERQRHGGLQAARDIAREAYWRAQGGGQF